jgi:hypothetical protein
VTSNFERRQQELAIQDDLRPYEGQWVAIRNGHAVAHDFDLGRLYQSPDVDPGDLIVAVPSPVDGPYLL